MVDIRDFLRRHGVPFAEAGEHHHVTEGWIGVHCPYCPPPQGNKGRFKLGINLETLACYCWSCGPHSLSDVLYRLTGESNVSVRRSFPAAGSIAVQSPPDKLYVPATVPLASIHRKFLQQRGFCADEIAKQWGVRGTLVHPLIPYALFIPVFFGGKLVSWTARSCSSSSTWRYRSCPRRKSIIPIKHTLYGWDDVKFPAVAIVEGPVDVWAIGKGYAVATYGKLVTQQQLQLLSKFPKRYIVWDADATQEAYRLQLQLSQFPGETFIVQLETGKDPAECSKEEIQQIRDLVAGKSNS